jgi:ATP-binding cassette subfamily B protein RaxB
VLVLDESTSHLDIQTEARLLTNLRALGLTIILVAHRLETINFADRILYLKDGVLPGRSAPVKVDEEISLPEPIEG